MANPESARGGIATDYSYRILKSAQYTKLKAKIVNGVVVTEQVEHLHTPRIAWELLRLLYRRRTGS